VIASSLLDDCDMLLVLRRWVVCRTGHLVYFMPRSLLLRHWWDHSGDSNSSLNRSLFTLSVQSGLGMLA